MYDICYTKTVADREAYTDEEVMRLCDRIADTRELLRAFEAEAK